MATSKSLKSSKDSTTWGSGPTKFFFDLGQEEVLKSLESLGFEVTGFCYALNSYENRVYEVELESRKKVVAKFYRPGRWTKQQIEEEHQWIFDLVKAEIPVAAPLVIGGKSLFVVPDQQIYFCVYDKHRGRTEAEVPVDSYRLLGSWIARLHHTGATRRFAHRAKLDANTYGRAALAAVQDSNLFPVEMLESYRRLTEELLSYIEPLFEGVAYQRVHGDCHVGNILWDEGSPLFVDFDDSLSAPSIQDLWLLLPGRDDYAVQKLDELVAGYSSLRHWDPNWLRLIEPLRALRLMHFQAWVIKRWQDPAFPTAFPQFTSPVHWREHFSDLQEILLMLKGIESTPWLKLY